MKFKWDMVFDMVGGGELLLRQERGVIYPLKSVFLQIGPQLQWWLHTNRRHQQTLETVLARTASGQEVWVTWENGTKVQIVEDGQFEALSPVTLWLVLNICFRKELGAQMSVCAFLLSGHERE